MNFKQTVINVLEEEMSAGGDASVFGPGSDSTSTQFSGDNYAAHDNRVPSSVFGGVITRNGLKKPKKRRKTKKNKRSHAIK